MTKDAGKVGSYYKYATNNRVFLRIVRGFKDSLNTLLKTIDFNSVLEVGCGEGEIINYINCNYPELEAITAYDIDDNIVSAAAASFPNINFMVGSAYDSLFPDESFDLVVCCEVLEHLERPEEALMNIINMSSRYVLVSVPNEPIWRICNMLRGSYLLAWGNTPGHVNHWTPQAFKMFSGSHARIIGLRKPFPWTMILLEKYDEGI